MSDFFITITNLNVSLASEMLYDKVLKVTSCTMPNSAFIVRGEETVPLDVLINQQQTTNVTITKVLSNVMYVPAAGSTDANLCGAGSLLLGSFKIDGVEYKDTPYLIMVTNG